MEREVKASRFSIHPPYRVQIPFKIGDGVFVADEFDFFAEAAEPRKELLADLHICCHCEMVVILFKIECVLALAEALDRSVQKLALEADLHPPLFAAHHAENLLTVFAYVYIVECGGALSGRAGACYFCHAVDPVCADVLSLVVECEQVIVAVVNQKGVGADDIFACRAGLYMLLQIAY